MNIQPSIAPFERDLALLNACPIVLLGLGTEKNDTDQVWSAFYNTEANRDKNAPDVLAAFNEHVAQTFGLKAKEATNVKLGLKINFEKATLAVTAYVDGRKASRTHNIRLPKNFNELNKKYIELSERTQVSTQALETAQRNSTQAHNNFEDMHTVQELGDATLDTDDLARITTRIRNTKATLAQAHTRSEESRKLQRALFSTLEKILEDSVTNSHDKNKKKPRKHAWLKPMMGTLLYTSLRRV